MNKVRNNNQVKSFLMKLRAKASIGPSMDEITKEVELARAKRYKKNEVLPRV